MINYILYNNFFITLLWIILYINIVLTNCTDKDKKDTKKAIKINNIENFKNKIINLFIQLICIIFMCLTLKFKNVLAIFMWFTIILSFYKIFTNYTKESLDLNFSNKHNYIAGTIFFILLFSKEAANIYIESFYMLSHTTKEILLLIYLVLKIIFIIFFILINFSIIISNIQILFGKFLYKLFYKLNHISFSYTPKYYNFHFSSIKKNKVIILIDKIIFIITCPFFIIINLIINIGIKLIKKIINITTKTYNYLLNYNDNRNIIIKKIIKISLIISLTIVYICTIYDANIFSSQIKEIYNQIVTVLLIPIIYDSIKSNNS